jgi:AraC-like DNA-binding protein
LIQVNLTKGSGWCGAQGEKKDHSLLTGSRDESGGYYWLVDEAEETRLCLSVADLEEQDKVQNYLYLALITINTIRQALDEPWCPTEITIPGMTTETAVKLSATLPGTRIFRDGPHASFLIPYSVLNHPMRASPDQAHKDSSESSAPPVPADFLSGISKLIEMLIITGHPDIGTAAKIIGLNKRTLQRRLAECDTSYSAVVAEARVALAIRWIREGKGSLTEIAGSLGYSDPANFSRAFRRITGFSPRAYRNRYKVAASP